MYYQLRKDTLAEITEEEFQKQEQTIAVVTGAEWDRDFINNTSFIINQKHDSIRFCKMENHAQYLFGTYHLPLKQGEDQHQGFVFYILYGKIIFIDDDDLVKKNIRSVLKKKMSLEYTLGTFFYDFLVSFLDDDLLYLGAIEKQISKQEERVMNGLAKNFSHEMLILKKEISRFHRYYSQLMDLGESLYERGNEFFGEDAQSFHILTERAQRLSSETQVLREYAMQVQEVYHAEIEIRQNNVMKMLTIVTTIFLPLTLIAGWYGMNFAYMPELSWKYGYLFVIIVSILIVLLSLLFFKKKKFL